MLKKFVNLAAAAALAMTAGPALAQIQTIDPNQVETYGTPADDGVDQQGWDDTGYETPAAEDPATSSEWTPTDEADDNAGNTASEAPAATTAAATATVPREDVFTAAEGVFGRGAQGLAGMLENILRDQGEPVAYISGQEAGGAFVFGVRYGSGVMRHQIEGERDVYWTGPSLGFDFGADANKVFVLVYNLHDSQDLFKRYPGAEGHAYVLGGFTAQYLRRGDVVLIPIRLGVGLRLGVNAGYMRFSERNRWLPF
ncbi:MAG TPA: DUF1134 domain-containing protein [Allosphingosinicella sp.]|nr:DUF1134 domain-containing protein [Allosphingosinicella sp.]